MVTDQSLWSPSTISAVSKHLSCCGGHLEFPGIELYGYVLFSVHLLLMIL